MDPSSPERVAPVDRRLSRYLRRQGATREEIDAAAADHMLTLLAIDQLLVPGRREHSAEDVAELSGVPPETATLLWRALGFPDVGEGDRVFTNEAVDVVRVIGEPDDNALFAPTDAEALVAQVRAIGAGLARVAETISDQMVDAIAAARAAGVDDETTALGVIDAIDWPTIARLYDFALRVQLRAALWRKLLTPQLETGEIDSLAVGFVDLVGYTALSQELDAPELSALVSRFESLAHDTVAQLGGRLVKTIGDEVMFVAEDPDVVLRIALVLTDRTLHDELLPRARAGLAYGPALAREGDYWGAVVNLAHRLVEIARPTSVLVAAELADALADREEYAFTRLRPRKIRGIGRVEIYAASATDVTDVPDRSGSGRG